MSEVEHTWPTYEPEMRTVQKDVIYAAITAIETGLEYIRDDLAAYKADPRYDSPKRVSYCVSRQEAEIAQMEAALEGLRKASASAAWADVANPDAWLEDVRGTP